MLRTGPQGEFKAYGRAGALRPLQRSDCWSAGTSFCQAPLRARIKAGRGDGGAGGRQAQMLEDCLHWPGLRDVGEHDAAAAAGAGEHVVAEDAFQQLGPWNASWVRGALALRDRKVGARRCGVLRSPWCGGARWLAKPSLGIR